MKGPTKTFGAARVRRWTVRAFVMTSVVTAAAVCASGISLIPAGAAQQSDGPAEPRPQARPALTKKKNMSFVLTHYDGSTFSDVPIVEHPADRSTVIFTAPDGTSVASQVTIGVLDADGLGTFTRTTDTAP
jgi:hypothetical protein